MTEKKQSVFQTLNAINVNEHTEKKNGLTYLSWAWAWAKVKENYPDASYSIYRDDNNHPYIEDPDFGIMCMTTVTIEGQTHEMWLPVMNGANKSMKQQPYTYKVWNYDKKSWDDKYVEAATMFDINKTIMRCLVKNLAMFGLGLYIYAGEDLPEAEQAQQAKPKRVVNSAVLSAAIEEAMKQTDVAKLEEVWNAHPEYHNTTSFISAVKTTKSFLEGKGGKK